MSQQKSAAVLAITIAGFALAALGVYALLALSGFMAKAGMVAAATGIVLAIGAQAAQQGIIGKSPDERKSFLIGIAGGFFVVAGVVLILVWFTDSSSIARAPISRTAILLTLSALCFIVGYLLRRKGPPQS